MSPGACKEIARKSATEYEVGRKIAMISLGGIPLGIPGDDARRGGPCRVSGVAMRGVHFRDKIRYRRRDGADRLPSSVAAAGAESGSDCLEILISQCPTWPRSPHQPRIGHYKTSCRSLDLI